MNEGFSGSAVRAAWVGAFAAAMTLAFPMSVQGQENYAQRQAQRQSANASVAPLRTPDFTPFAARMESALKKLSGVNRELETASIADLQRLLEERKLDSADLVCWYVDRIRRYDAGRLRSVLELNPEALVEARFLDTERAAGRMRGRLHGIPVLLKDNIATAGKLHTTAGAAALLDAVPDRDAAVVARLRACGAIVLGKTNLTEWANFMSSRSINGYSTVGGQTMNPYGAFDVGGSSAGSAVAAACNFAAAAIGTETYGSIVYPAAFNSVVGLKPTVGLVSRDRIIPITDSTDTAGPMTRTCADAAAVLTAISGPDPNDAESMESAKLFGADFVQSLDPQFLKGKKLAVLNGAPGPETDQAIRKQVLNALRSAGAELQTVDFPRKSFPFGRIFQCGFKHGVDAYLQATSAPIRDLAAVVEFNAADPDNRARLGQQILMESSKQTLSLEDYRKLIQENRQAARDALEPVFAQCDLIVSWEYAGMHGGVFPMAGVPVLCLPAGYRETGEPVGFLIVGRRFEDGKVLSAGHSFESQLKLRRTPRLHPDS